MKNKAREVMHSFCEVYRILFKDFEPKNLLEIGTYEGDGIWFWHKMFPDIEITSVDIKKYGDFEIPLKTTLIYSDIKTLDLNTIPNFDIIIDDASHTSEDQKYVLSNLTRKLNKDGWLIIEDVPGHNVAKSLVEFVDKKEKTFIVDRQFCRGDRFDEFLIVYRNI